MAGFVLPHLRERHSLTGSSWRLALLWGAWHAPLLAIVETFRGFTAGSVIGFVIGLTAGFLVLATIYEKTGASILAAESAHPDAPVRAAVGL